MSATDNISKKRIIKAVAQVYCTTEDKLLNDRRYKTRHVRARHVAMYLCRKLCRQNSYPSIAKAFKRHHTAIIEAVKKVEYKIERHDSWRCEVFESQSQCLFGD